VFAQRLAARGHALLLAARDGDRLASLAAELTQTYGVAVRTMAVDLATPAGLEELASVLEREPEVGVLVNNAGFGTKGKIHTAPLSPQMAMLQLHVLAPMRLCQAVLPGMVSRGRGWIINNSSVASFMYGPGNANYAATKAYLTRFTLGLDTEVFDTGVVVQALCPGFTRSEFHDRMSMNKAKIPLFLWNSAEFMVDASLAAAERGGPVVLIPGLKNKLLTWLVQLTPHWVKRRSAGITQRVE
jgi:short-subunit dehydrogenase